MSTKHAIARFKNYVKSVKMIKLHQLAGIQGGPILPLVLIMA